MLESERLKNTLLSSVSHDLRTPLTAIMGSASGLLELKENIKPDIYLSLAKNIYQQSSKLNSLLNNLLQMMRLEAGSIVLHKELQSLEEIIGSALNSLEQQLSLHDIQIKLAPNLPLIKMDGLLIEQVFYNLIENALKFTPKDAQIEISARSLDHSILIKIVDNGPGIPKEDLVHLFEKFYRGRLSHIVGGAGLGLAICKSIINAHNGKIWAENRKGGGAAFYFILPI